jgi:hypothetical protein
MASMSQDIEAGFAPFDLAAVVRWFWCVSFVTSGEHATEEEQ